MRIITTLICLLLLAGILNASEPPAASNGSNDALAEVNAYRAKRGLPPFQPDPQLTKAALTAATKRAARGIHGHLPESDFTCLPIGATADAAGCGALEDSWGWGTCLMDSTEYQIAGAAWVRGADGLRYMHIFCRHGQQPATTTKPTTIEPLAATGEALTCTSGSCGAAQQPRRLSRRRR